jgi:zinc protease
MQEEISKIKQNGPIPKDVQLFINRDARTMQQQLKQNEYWQATLSVAVQNQQDPDRILNHMQDLEQVTPQSVKETANKYLNNNLIKLILLPEKK